MIVSDYINPQRIVKNIKENNSSIIKYIGELKIMANAASNPTPKKDPTPKEIIKRLGNSQIENLNELAKYASLVGDNLTTLNVFLVSFSRATGRCMSMKESDFPKDVYPDRVEEYATSFLLQKKAILHHLEAQKVNTTKLIDMIKKI